MTCTRKNLRRIEVRSLSEDAAKVLKETAALDQLIDVLLEATSQQQLAQLVAQNITAFDTKLWLRVATRSDSASSEQERDALNRMAQSCMLLVDAMLKKSERELEDSSKVLQDILAAAADDRGEWYLPLTTIQVAALRAAMERHKDRLDEALLSNAFAWIRKCNDDGLDGMVTLLQKVLQLYAARVLKGPEETGVEGVMNQIIAAEEKEWAGLISGAASEGRLTEAGLMEALQRKMEGTVLGLTSGSYAQRVQAEYLKEIEARAKTVFRELASK